MMKRTLLFLAVMAITFTQAQVSLVKDINAGVADGLPSYVNNRVSFNNKLVFSASNGITNNGFELWMTDGTNSGTEMVKEIFPGQGSSNPKNFTEWQNELVFAADVSNVTIRKDNLFRTDLTEIGTVIMAGGLNFPIPPFFYKDEMYSGDRQLFKFATINSNYQPSNISTSPGTTVKLILTFNNLLFYTTPTALFAGSELWATDGTYPGSFLVKDIYPGPVSSQPEDFVIFNNKIYFSADDGVNGRELWVSDGTTLGTTRVFDINPVAGDLTNPQNLIVYNNALYFTASHPTLGNEIFKLTNSLAGVTITNLKNIAPASGANSNPSNLFIFNGKLYFSADDGTNGIELWSSTGFASTTNMVKDINISAATPDSNPSGFAEYFGELYFAADDGVNGRELWKTDGTDAGTVLVGDINTSGDSNPSDLIVASNQLFFSANDGVTGKELWKYQDSSLSTKSFELENTISIHPNPTSDRFSVESKFKVNTLEILDITGKQIKLFVDDMVDYNIEDLTSGVYFVKLQTEKGSITKKLLKE